jgi:hypothetical protein
MVTMPALVAGLFVLGGAALPSPSLAQDRPAFRSSAPLTVAADEALHRFALPLEAYRDARRDLGDLRVLNAAGEPVPFAIAGAEDRPPAPAPVVALPVFPVSTAVVSGADGVGVLVRTGRDGAVIAVEPRARPSASDPTTWLLDASKVGDPIQALVVEWDAGPGSEVVHVDLDESDDLRRWRRVIAGTALVRVSQGTEVLSQPRIEFSPRRARYLRLSAGAAGFRLRAARAETVAGAVEVPRESRRVAGRPGDAAGEFAFDLGASLPVESVRLRLAERNTIAPLTLLARDEASEDWQRVTVGTSYRLTRDGVEVESPATEVGRHVARHWLVRIDARAGSVGSEPPALEVGWRPAQVVFVARGEAPFRVAFGNPSVDRAALPLTSLMPGYAPRAEHALPVATVGEVTTAALPGDGWRGLLGEDGGRRLLLWGVLVLGVIVLGGMAWRLHRQVTPAP